jgi:hypothetical protein
MAMTACHECGKKVSNKAKSCPHCGAKNPGRKKQKGIGWGPGCLIILALFAFAAIINLSEDHQPPISPKDVLVTEGSPMEVLLASIDESSPVVRRSLVVVYAAFLTRLDARCIESRKRIGDMAARATELIKDNYGREVKVLTVLRELDVATSPPIEPGQNCTELLGLLVPRLGLL